MRHKWFLSFVLFLLLFFLSFFSLTSAFLISDQGTSVRNSTGSLLENGNLTIAVYDNITAGNLIFNSTTQGAIINGSWNLMINPIIEYGFRYWKDYEINGEDVDFDGNERLEFQSSVGYINNISFINFSLINSCPSGSSIRLIYSNGSVECEADDSGNGTGSDLTNYALKNQSEIFSGNITTAYTGFFGFLGSLANRITKLFVSDIDVSGNVNATGNVTASYFRGDGSLLTNLPAGAESDPIFVSENSTLWNAINLKLAQSDQRYNDTALILSVNATSNIMSLGFYNRTEIDGLISGVSAGNSSFNQSLTNSLYYSIANPLNFINHTLASVYNDTALILTTNSSLWNYINFNFGNWNATFNFTYNNLLSQQCSAGYFVNGTLSNGTFTCAQSALSESDPLWTANSTSVLYIANLPLENRTISHINNITGFSFNYNQTAPAIADVNNRFWNKTYIYNKTEIDVFNASWTSTFNETYATNIGNSSWNETRANGLYAGIQFGYNQTISAINYASNINTSLSSRIDSISTGNSSFNQSLTDTLYSGIQWNYNQTIPANVYTNSVNSSIVSWVDSFFVRIANIFNRTEIQNQYYNKTEIGSLDYVNSTGLQSYNDTALINSINQTLSLVKLDISDQRYNDTALILSVNTTANIMSLSFYNRGEVNALINSSFNQSFTDLLYYSVANPLSFINHTLAGVYNDTLIVLNVNSTLWSVINSNSAGWGATFNSTYNNLIGAQCPVGRVVNGTLLNGTLSCVIDSTDTGNIFNQVLNTTSNVTFANITVSREITINGVAVSMWLYNQSDGSYNVTYNQFAYNQTTSAVNDINLRFWNRTQTWNVTQLYNKTEIDVFNASWTSTFNSTYSNIINQQCSAGLVVNGTLVNGTFTCITPSVGAESDPLWGFNLTSGVSSDLNPLTNIIQSLGNSTKRWLKGWFKDLDVSNNANVSGNVSAQFYFGSLNRSTFPTSSCSGTDKVISVLANGTVNCGADQTGSGSGTSFATFNITTSDISTSDNVNYVEVITLPLNSGFNIMIECILFQDSVATGTGVHYNSVLTGTLSQRQVMEYYSSTTAQAICQGTAATLTCLPTSSSGTTVTPNRLYVYAVTSSAGTFTLNVKSETSNAVSVKAGSWCRSIET